MALSFTNLSSQVITNSVPATSYSNGSWTPANALIIALNAATVSPGGPPNVPTMSGNSLTWTALGNILSGPTNTNTRIIMFAANGSGATAGATTITWGGSSVVRDGQVTFLQVDGADLSGGVAGAIVQTVTGSGNGASLTLTLASAGNAANRPVAGWADTFDTSHTTRTNWTNYYNPGGTGVSEIVSADYRSDAFETTAVGTATSGTGDWTGIAIEIKALITASGNSNFFTFF